MIIDVYTNEKVNYRYSNVHFQWTHGPGMAEYPDLFAFTMVILAVIFVILGAKVILSNTYPLELQLTPIDSVICEMTFLVFQEASIELYNSNTVDICPKYIYSTSISHA